MGKFRELMKTIFKRTGSVQINDINYEGKTITISSNGSNTRVTVNGVEVHNSNSMQTLNVSVKGDVEYISTVSGDIEVQGNSGRTESTSGNINIAGSVKGDVSTISGDVKSSSITGNVKTISGDIKR